MLVDYDPAFPLTDRGARTGYMEATRDAITKFLLTSRSSFACLFTGAALLAAGCDSGSKVGQVETPEPAAAATPALVGSTVAPGAAANDPRFKQTFAEATRADTPTDIQRPPDLTLTGKSVGKLYSDLVALWPTIQLVGPDGNLIPYVVTLETDVGNIEIALRPDLAPNHVRNFIALTMLGYYDGWSSNGQCTPSLPITLNKGRRARRLPGTGDIGVGSLGYWLKTEYSKESHDVGTIAPPWHRSDTACSRLYMTLSKAPVPGQQLHRFRQSDRRTRWAKRIFSLPVRNDTEFPEGIVRKTGGYSESELCRLRERKVSNSRRQSNELDGPLSAWRRIPAKVG